MNPQNFAIITPSYAPDFERCQLLCRSIDSFVSPAVNHYIIADQKDLSLFGSLTKPGRYTIPKESLLPWWLIQLPLPKNFWLSLKSLPIRGWLLQQIVKIAAAQQIEAEVCVFIDSDVAFVRPFNLHNFVRDHGQIRLFRNNGSDEQKRVQHKWHESACRLLQLPYLDNDLPDYIGQIITWKKTNVIHLCQYIETISGQSWIEVLANSWHISEYVLYGIFVDRILQDKSDHYHDSQIISHDYWYNLPLSQQKLSEFLQQIQPEQVAVMISAKAGIPVKYYQDLLDAVISEY